MVPFSTRSAERATPAMEIGDCWISRFLAFNRPTNSLCTRFATRCGFFAARAAASNWSASSRVEVRTSASLGEIPRSEEHTSELQSRVDLVCRLLLEKKKKKVKKSQRLREVY